MKKIFCPQKTSRRTYTAFILLLSFLFTFVFPLCTDARTENGWYVKRNPEHRQPILEPEQQFIEKYDGYYIDKRFGDDSSEKVLYLTFDLGYVNDSVASILDTLSKENVPAAFFVLEHVIKKNSDVVCRMVEDGHLVCNHSMYHKDMTKMDREGFRQELEGLEKDFKELTGKEMPKYYRPPRGQYNEQNLQWAKEMGYKTVFWSFAYADWDNGKQMEVVRAKKKIRDNMHNGAVLLLHPTSKTNALLLPELIREWKEAGYRFGTLDELTKK